ncbi:histidine phosphatase family protein [Vibrio alginolyticus]|uniref:histidine phosphatase family protein n=1 Tax=Vibrio alginolyticus TaxID=663 RepID=UPI00215C1064|nr:histidine phosphatase family protein [Vibrio alginolyticus]MCR9504440.1 phosphoglycerate mutase family protein [Vibrio alginolyticus]
MAIQDIVFVGHGEPDYSLTDKRKMSQLEKDYAPLHREHIHPLHSVAKEIQAEGAELIISSLYTRALQTAELINRNLSLDIFVEHDLREWRADSKGGYVELQARERRWHEYRDSLRNNSEISNAPYESWVKLKDRAETFL